MILQHFISKFAPPLALLKKMQLDRVALLSANEEYENEQVTEFESTKGKTRNAE